MRSISHTNKEEFHQRRLASIFSVQYRSSSISYSSRCMISPHAGYAKYNLVCIDRNRAELGAQLRYLARTPTISSLLAYKSRRYKMDIYININLCVPLFLFQLCRSIQNIFSLSLFSIDEAFSTFPQCFGLTLSLFPVFYFRSHKSKFEPFATICNRRNSF